MINIKPTAIRRIIFFITIDTVVIFTSLYFSYIFRFGFVIPEIFSENILNAFALLLLLKLSFLFVFKIYFVAWRYFALVEAKKILIAMFLSNALFAVLFVPFNTDSFPKSIIIIDFFISFVLIGVIRISKRLISEKQDSGKIIKSTIILGVNQKTSSIINSYINKEINYRTIAIFSKQANIVNTYMLNVKIFSFDKLEEVIKKNGIDTAILAENYPPKELDLLFERLSASEVKEIKLARLFDSEEQKLKDISIEDLLARKPKDLDIEAIGNFIKDKTVMITGAGGSIGSEIARQCAEYKAKKLILVDNSEFNLYRIGEELENDNIISFLCSVVDKESLENIFKNNPCELVIHAAAYKHVPLVESNVCQAIRNNVIGTKNTVDIAIKYNVSKFVMISTDKAVRPTNVMGATKRICELYIQNINKNNTDIVAVRFGNVLGSSGSVIPKFEHQIINDLPLTVTHPDITRYFMLIPEACKLVLQSAAMEEGGELFILDMGEPIKIVNLAKKMLRLYNKDDLEIIFTGLRPGEKLYEELLIGESEKKTDCGSIFIGETTEYDIDKLNKDIQDLLTSKDKLAMIKGIVPEFNHNHN